MSLPPIDPTGAMASGDYVEYMIEYNNDAADYMLDELTKYVTQSTIDDWDGKWTRILGDTSTDLTALENAVSKLVSQARMASDAIDKL